MGWWESWVQTKLELQLNMTKILTSCRLSRVCKTFAQNVWAWALLIDNLLFPWQEMGLGCSQHEIKLSVLQLIWHIWNEFLGMREGQILMIDDKCPGHHRRRRRRHPSCLPLHPLSPSTLLIIGICLLVLDLHWEPLTADRSNNGGTQQHGKRILWWESDCRDEMGWQ